jgi:TRAP-type C4-dicarboxylate transport system permease small subunit
MSKVVKISALVITSIFTVLFCVTTVYRATWEYNENGIHFDEQSITTYSDGATISYGVLSIVFFVLTVMLIRNIIKSRRTSNLSL